MTEVEKLYRFFLILAIAGIILAVMSFFGSVTSRQALKRGHTPRMWFWIGFFFPAIGLIVLFLMKPGVAAQAARRTRSQELVKLGFVVAAAAAGFLIAWVRAGWKWGLVWAAVAAMAAVPGDLSARWLRSLAVPEGETPQQQQRSRRVVIGKLALVLAAVGAGLGVGLWLSTWHWAVLWAIVAGVLAFEFAATGLNRERVWVELTPEEQRRAHRSMLIKSAVVIAFAAVGFVVGWIVADPEWGLLWAGVGAAVGIACLMVVSILTDLKKAIISLLVAAGGAVLGIPVGMVVDNYRPGDNWVVLFAGFGAVAGMALAVHFFAGAGRHAASPADYTPSEKRPPEPRRVVTLVLPLMAAILLFWVGGVFADAYGGAVWGVFGTAGAVAALYLAKERPDLRDAGVLAVGIIASTMLTLVVLPERPESLTANLSLLMAAAWIPAGIAGAIVQWRRNPSPSNSTTLVLGWAGAGLLALPAGVAFDILKPLESWVGEPDPFGTTIYAFIAVTVALIGVAFILSGATGLNSLATTATVLYVTAYAGAQVGFTIPGLVRNFTNLTEVAKKMWPPDFEWAIGTGSWWNIASWDFGHELRANPLIETFRIAIIACLIGVTIAVPLALRASKVTAIRGSDYWLNKGFMNVIRTIPDLFWAMIFATSVGIGPFAGTLALIFFSMAIMAKLLSETVDAVDPRPIEAARSTGSHHWPAMRTSVWPQVLPNYVAYALYIFEINIRASVVLGIVGAGGIGRVLEAQRAFFRFDRVLAIVIVIFAIVFLIEQASVALRRRLV